MRMEISLCGILPARADLLLPDVREQQHPGFTSRLTRRHARKVERDSNPDARIRYRPVGLEAPEALWGHAADLGSGGTCLVCENKNEVGDHLALEIHVTGHAPIPALARVLRCEAAPGGFRCGLEFLWLESTDQDCLAALAAQDQRLPPRF
jgi:hypothetical protein